MSPLLVALLGALVVPLLVGTVRASLLGLACQGWVMAAIAYRTPAPADAQSVIALVDLGLVRGLVMPLALYRVLRARHAPHRNDVIAPNLFSWTLALALVLIAFNVSDRLVREPGEPQALVAVALAGALLGFLVLASASGPFGQMMGVLRIENAIALLELSGAHHSPLALQLAMVVVFIATIGLFRWFLSTLATSPEPPHEAAPDSPTL